MDEGVLVYIFDGMMKVVKLVVNFVKFVWGDEYFLIDGMSNENEMSVV